MSLDNLTCEELDKYAWDAICTWPSRTSFNVVHTDLDYSHLTRWFLWDKVGRAIRRMKYPESFDFENQLIQEAKIQNQKRGEISKKISRALREMTHKADFYARCLFQPRNPHQFNKPTLFTPTPAMLFQNVFKEIIRSQSANVLTYATQFPGYRRAKHVLPRKKKSRKNKI